MAQTLFHLVMTWGRLLHGATLVSTTNTSMTRWWMNLVCRRSLRSPMMRQRKFKMKSTPPPLIVNKRGAKESQSLVRTFSRSNFVFMALCAVLMVCNVCSCVYAGHNFGDAGAFVYIGGEICADPVHEAPGTQISCTTPAAVGSIDDPSDALKDVVVMNGALQGARIHRRSQPRGFKLFLCLPADTICSILIVWYQAFRTLCPTTRMQFPLMTALETSQSLTSAPAASILSGRYEVAFYCRMPLKLS